MGIIIYVELRRGLSGELTWFGGVWRKLSIVLEALQFSVVRFGLSTIYVDVVDNGFACTHLVEVWYLKGVSCNLWLLCALRMAPALFNPKILHGYFKDGAYMVKS